MRPYAVIAETGSKLVALLRRELVPELLTNENSIAMCAPSERKDCSIGIHLYDIGPAEEAGGGSRGHTGETRQKYPSSYLSLYYMITVYSESDGLYRAMEEQQLTGKIIQVLQDYPILSLDDTGEDHRHTGRGSPVIQMIVLDVEEKMKLWNVPDTPYRLSVFYKVSPVELISGRERAIRRVSDVDIRMQKKER